MSAKSTTLLYRLKSAQPAAARLIFSASGCVRVTPLVRDGLHYTIIMCVRERIVFRLAVPSRLFGTHLHYTCEPKAATSPCNDFGAC